MTDTDNGKNPSGYAKYVGDYWKTDWTHALLHEYPVSTGPYYLKEYEEDSYMVFEYNPYYWNKTLWKDLFGFEASTGTYLAQNSGHAPIFSIVTAPIRRILKL